MNGGFKGERSDVEKAKEREREVREGVSRVAGTSRSIRDLLIGLSVCPPFA